MKNKKQGLALFSTVLALLGAVLYVWGTRDDLGIFLVLAAWAILLLRKPIYKALQ